MQFLLALLPLLPTLALAAPVASTASAPAATPTPFTLMSVRSASPIHYGTVNANGEAFWIGKPSANSCPPNLPDNECGQLNNASTILSCELPDNAKTRCGFDTVVPGGQTVYVGQRGALRYTVPHGDVVPKGAHPAGFVHTPPTETTDYGLLTFEGAGADGFVACPTNGTFPYQVFANIEGARNFDECLGFELFALPYTGAPAWEYL